MVAADWPIANEWNLDDFTIGFFVYFGHTEPLTHRLMFVFENTRDGVVLEIGLLIHTRLHNTIGSSLLPTQGCSYTRMSHYHPKINKIPDLDSNWSIGIWPLLLYPIVIPLVVGQSENKDPPPTLKKKSHKKYLNVSDSETQNTTVHMFRTLL